MINGDGIHEGNSDIASSDPWRAQKVDVGSPISSRYSSCEESEFERYCSANSAMGTPSMCSTITIFNECPDSEFGYGRNFGFNDDSGLENFSLGGSERSRLDRNITSYRKIELSEKVIDGESELSMKYGSTGLNLYETEELFDSQEVTGEIFGWKVESTSELFRLEKGEGSEDGSGEEATGSGTVVDAVLGDVSYEEVHVESLGGAAVENGMKSGQSFGESFLPCLVDKESGSKFDRMEGDTLKNEYSESEDSMSNILSDDDNEGETFMHHNTPSLKETNTVNENPLLINSSVAFGSDDWNDFECEIQGYSVNSSTMALFQESKQQNLDSSSLTLAGSPIVTKMERGEDVVKMLVAGKEDKARTNFLENINFTPGARVKDPTVGKPIDMIEVRDIPVAIYQAQVSTDSSETTNCSYFTEASAMNDVVSEQDAKDIFVINNQAGETDKTTCNSECPVGHITKMGSVAEKVPIKLGNGNVDGTSIEKPQIPESEDNIVVASQTLGRLGLGILSANSSPLSDILINRLSARDIESCENVAYSSVEPESKAARPTFGSQLQNISSISTDLSKDYLLPVELAKLDLNDIQEEFVQEMEEILLDSGDSLGPRFTRGNEMSQSLPSLSFRDGGSTASISGSDESDLIYPQTLRIDGVEVIGARQKRGDVSFSERLVGVKEYTVYIIRVWSGKEKWEVERRYRDFYSLYCQLKSLFADHSWSLPSPWSSIDNRSRMIFGSASPDIIAERSLLIQECLCSILHSSFLSTTPSALIWFLSPQESSSNSPSSGTPVSRLSSVARASDTLKLLSLGKTISLVVEIRPCKSTKQILELQHYTCAGCHRHFNDQKTLMNGFVQTFGWGKPRLCEYTCQLFCSSCHTNEMAVIPAKVLHHWDFTRYPVSQLAKSYLDSIRDQPMLCVSAVNPSLFSKVPALLQVMSVRKKLGNMIPYVRCPFRKSIRRGLGSRRYLVESSDFFALRDLIDLSKGAFAALPIMLETVSRKILEHIVEKCLVCCDAGVSCGARQMCSDPLALIFPFQEFEVEKCKSCESMFHKPCIGKLTNCSCGACLTTVDRRLGIYAAESGAANSFLRKSTSILPLRSLSGIFAKSNQAKEIKDNENIILMGSLPTTSL